MIPTKPGWYWCLVQGKRQIVMVYKSDMFGLLARADSWSDRPVVDTFFTEWSAEIIDPKTLEKK